MSKKPRVFFLLHLPPPVHGSSMVGLNIRQSEVINEGFDSVYFNLLASRDVADNGRISIRKVTDYLGTAFRVLGSLIKRRPALCYFALSTTGAAFYKDLVLVAMLKLFGVPIVFHLHNKGIALRQHVFFHKLSYRFVFRNTKVVVLSPALEQDIAAFVKPADVIVCPNGILDEAVIASELPATEKISKPFFQILFLSNLIESKGVYVLLEALAILVAEGHQFHCSFVGGEGDVSGSQFAGRVASLGLQDRVTYEGRKFGTEKQQAFLDADIFVLPTYYNNECFPLVLLEAMSYSIPLVSTYEGGIRDMIVDGKTGYLVPQRDVTVLANRLALLGADKDLRSRLGSAGRRMFEREFTLQIFEHRMAGILRDQLKAH